MPEPVPLASAVTTTATTGGALVVQPMFTKRTGAGPYAGKHVPPRYVVCPPEWDISPSRYRDLAEVSRGIGTVGALFSSSSVVLGALASAAAIYDLGVVHPVTFFFIAITVFFAISVTMLKFPRLLPFAYARTLDDVDPKLAVPIKLPGDLTRLIDVVSNVDHGVFGDPADGNKATAALRGERLRVSYDATIAMHRACQANNDWTVDTVEALTRACPVETQALIALGLRLRGSNGPAYAKQVQAVVLNNQQRTLTPAPQVVESSPARTTWAESIHTHDAISEAWGAILCDPLTALTHSALLDMNEARTVRFVEAYGEAQDLRAVHGLTFPALNEMAVKDYRTAVRRADEAWTEAVRYSEHVTFDWLPANEADSARKAAGFLALAADESATMHERATAAGKAADLLRKVKSFLLPPTAIHALEAQVRLELMPASSVATTGGPILGETVLVEHHA